MLAPTPPEGGREGRTDGGREGGGGEEEQASHRKYMAPGGLNEIEHLDADVDADEGDAAVV